MERSFLKTETVRPLNPGFSYENDKMIGIWIVLWGLLQLITWQVLIHLSDECTASIFYPEHGGTIFLRTVVNHIPKRTVN